MLNANRIFVLLAAACAFFALAVYAADEPKYDPGTELTLRGAAEYVANHPSGADWTGVYVIMSDPKGGEIEVHLAPSDFLSHEGVSPKRGDNMEVVGSRVRWHGADIVLAREVTDKNKTAVLRDKNGARRW